MKIEQKIVAQSVLDEAPTPTRMHEEIERPGILSGCSYKIKTPLSEHALYITINDIILNHGTDHEERRPFEIFINSRCMDNFQWIVALTRVISAVFRKGGEVAFLADELRSVFDPRGGYFKKGGVYMPSLVAEIGGVIQEHLQHIGMVAPPNPAPVVQVKDQPARPKGKQCPHCREFAMVKEGGCEKCHNCGEAGECG